MYQNFKKRTSRERKTCNNCKSIVSSYIKLGIFIKNLINASDLFENDDSQVTYLVPLQIKRVRE